MRNENDKIAMFGLDPYNMGSSLIMVSLLYEVPA